MSNPYTCVAFIFVQVNFLNSYLLLCPMVFVYGDIGSFQGSLSSKINALGEGSDMKHIAWREMKTENTIDESYSDLLFLLPLHSN